MAIGVPGRFDTFKTNRLVFQTITPKHGNVPGGFEWWSQKRSPLFVAVADYAGSAVGSDTTYGSAVATDAAV